MTETERHIAFAALIEEMSNPRSPHYGDSEWLERERVKLHEQGETTSD